MKAGFSVLCTTRQMSFNVDPGVRYLTVGPTISARASENRTEKLSVNDGVNSSLLCVEIYKIKTCLFVCTDEV